MWAGEGSVQIGGVLVAREAKVHLQESPGPANALEPKLGAIVDSRIPRMAGRRALAGAGIPNRRNFRM